MFHHCRIACKLKTNRHAVARMPPVHRQAANIAWSVQACKDGYRDTTPTPPGTAWAAAAGPARHAPHSHSHPRPARASRRRRRRPGRPSRRTASAAPGPSGAAARSPWPFLSPACSAKVSPPATRSQPGAVPLPPSAWAASQPLLFRSTTVLAAAASAPAAHQRCANICQPFCADLNKARLNSGANLMRNLNTAHQSCHWPGCPSLPQQTAAPGRRRAPRLAEPHTACAQLPVRKHQQRSDSIKRPDNAFTATVSAASPNTCSNSIDPHLWTRSIKPSSVCHPGSVPHLVQHARWRAACGGAGPEGRWAHEDQKGAQRQHCRAAGCCGPAPSSWSPPCRLRPCAFFGVSTFRRWIGSCI